MGRKISKLASIALGALIALALTTGPTGAATIVVSFNPQLGRLVSIAYDSTSGNLFLYPEFGESINEVTPDGALVDQGIPRPGASSNDFDLDFAQADVNVGGKTVPAGSLLVGNGDDSPPTIYGIDKDAGSVLGSVQVQGVTPVGMAHHPARGTIYLLNWTTNEVVEVDPATGTVLNRMPVHPPGARTYSGSAFSVFYGDVDVHPTTGNLFVLGSNYPVIRELSPTGQWIGDVDLTSLNIPSGMSGLAFDNNGDAWVATLDGTVYKLGNVVSSNDEPPPECGDANAICTGDEDDTVDGTSGDDFIFTGAGEDSVQGGAGEDVIQTGSGNDAVSGGVGSDDIDGGDGNDALVGDGTVPSTPRSMAGSSNDSLKGGAGTDSLKGNAGNDILLGQLGNDILLGGSGSNVLNGGPGKDTCIATSRRDTFKSCEKKRRNF